MILVGALDRPPGEELRRSQYERSDRRTFTTAAQDLGAALATGPDDTHVRPIKFRSTKENEYDIVVYVEIKNNAYPLHKQLGVPVVTPYPCLPECPGFDTPVGVLFLQK